MKVSIIEVNLSETISKIIDDDLREMSTGTKAELDTIIGVAKKNKEIKEAKERKIEDEKTKLTTAMSNAYELLKIAGDTGIESEKIMNIVSGSISTPSSFALRMKTYLKNNGNEYILTKIKNKYYFKPFNLA